MSAKMSQMQGNGKLHDVVSVLVYFKTKGKHELRFLFCELGGSLYLPWEEVKMKERCRRVGDTTPSPEHWRRDVSYDKIARDIAVRTMEGMSGQFSTAPQLVQLTRVFISDLEGHYQHLVFCVQAEEKFSTQLLAKPPSDHRRALTLAELYNLKRGQLERRDIITLAEHVSHALCRLMQSKSGKSDTFGALVREVGVGWLWEGQEDGQMSSYQALLRAPGYNHDSVSVLYEEFIRSSYPHTTVCLNDIKELLSHLGWKDKEESVFRAFDKEKTGELSLEEFFYGMAAIDTKTNHGQGPAEVRCRCIFRYYDTNEDDRLEISEVEAMVRDIEALHGRDTSQQTITAKTKEALQIFGVVDQVPLSLSSFLSAVGNLKFRGTSVLLRALVSPIMHLTSTHRHPSRKRSVSSDCSENDLKIQKVGSDTGLDGTTDNELEAVKMLVGRDLVDQELPMVLSSNSEASIPLSEGAFQSQDGQKYSLAQHTVKVRRSGQITDIHRLLDMERAGEVSDTGLDTDEASDHSPDPKSPKELVQQCMKIPTARHRLINRFQSYEAFDTKSLSNEMVAALRFFEHQKKNKPALHWGEVDMVKLGQYIISLCNAVREKFENEPRLLRLSTPCYILGDLHGNFRDLVCFEKGLWRVGPQLTPANFLFLGDYVDRGAYGIEVVAYLFALKLQASNKFFLLRGNHEVREIQQAFTFHSNEEEFCFHSECLQKFGERLGQSVWEAVNSAFDCMPLAAIVDKRIFCIHGGIPKLEGSLSELEKIPCPLVHPESESYTAWQMMWNDPIAAEDFHDGTEKELEENKGFAYNYKRQTALLFNRAAFDNFLKQFGLTHVVRAHEVKQAGFEIQQGGQLMTVFSSSHYCGGSNEAACILLHNYQIRVIRIDTS